jgi:hypothetical protein
VVHPYLKKIGKSVTMCSLEASEYTTCCTAKELNINQYDCHKEYEKLMLCVRNKMKNIK